MAVIAFKRKNAHKRTETVTDTLSPEERRAKGKALRDAVPRESHGSWKAPKGRRDPIDLLNESNERRLQQLVPIRFGRMLQSPFTFFRGSAAIMAADLASTPVSGITVQACGDAHLLNFGGFATPERRVIFDINDFDETLPAPWEWDIKRLAASVVIAGRDLRFSESDSARAAGLQCARTVNTWTTMQACGRLMFGTTRSTSNAFSKRRLETRSSGRSSSSALKRHTSEVFQNSYFRSL